MNSALHRTLSAAENIPLAVPEGGAGGQHVQQDGSAEGEGEEQDEDEDMSSEVSEGDNLVEDLEGAIDTHQSFQGSYYYASTLSSAPNPCLQISGLGLVGLPLTERGAKCIISYGSLAPFGHGERIVVDKHVRDTWEIESARVSFANPEWMKYVEGVVHNEVCNNLGVGCSKVPPRLELYKLLLYEQGSHFLPHQDTQKSPGMFATVIVLLPSAYTGGQVHLSHSSQTKVVDFSASSLLTTSVMAWYTDVVHEVKPIASGYRLALSYNLIHEAPPGIPTPSLPDLSAPMSHLRRVLKKWRHDAYDEIPDPNLVAYLLSHQYSPAELKEGVKILKGTDAQRVAFLRSVAEDEGYVLAFAALEHNVSGSGDDSGGGYYSRRRYDSWGGRSGYVPEMIEVDSSTSTISGLVDLSGRPLLLAGGGKIPLKEECLIPKDAFDEVTPDDSEYEGYMGNYPGQVEHIYRRTVVVLMHEDNMDDICFSVGGIHYALSKLAQSSTVSPSSQDRLWAQRVLTGIQTWKLEHLLAMMEYSLKWRDGQMWRVVMRATVCKPESVPVAKLVQAWKIFGFDGVRLNFEEMVARSNQFKQQLAFIDEIGSYAPAEQLDVIIKWCSKESQKILSSYTKPHAQDVEMLISHVARPGGIQAVVDSLMPNLLKKSGTYSFLIAFSKALHQKKQVIIEAHQLPGTDRTKSALETYAQLQELAKQCLRAAIPQWEDGATSYYSVGTLKVDHIIELAEHCIAIMRILKQISQDLCPLIPRLIELIKRKNENMFMPPYIGFLQAVIEKYGHDILGRRPSSQTPKLRPIGCGCGDCVQLDRFMLNPRSTTESFQLYQARRVHIEHRAALASDLCTWATVRTGSPYSVKVTKHPQVVNAAMWEIKQDEANEFFKLFGTSEDLNKVVAQNRPSQNTAASRPVMTAPAAGSSRPAVPPASAQLVSAVASTPFQANPPGSSRGGAGVMGALGGQNSFTNSNQVPTATAPTLKRKNGPLILGPVIDLSED